MAVGTLVAVLVGGTGGGVEGEQLAVRKNKTRVIPIKFFILIRSSRLSFSFL
jgi:hypothetical protein